MTTNSIHPGKTAEPFPGPIGKPAPCIGAVKLDLFTAIGQNPANGSTGC